MKRCLCCFLYASSSEAEFYLIHAFQGSILQTYMAGMLIFSMVHTLPPWLELSPV